MIALLLSIVLSTYLVLVFKIFKRYGIDNLQAIIFNYMTCVVTGILFSGKIPTGNIFSEGWFPYAVFLGISFFSIFNMMGYVAANIGVTLTSVASKLSMVIPVAFAVYLYDQKFTLIKIAGLLLAIGAVYLTSVDTHSKTKDFRLKGLLLAFTIFIGSGINDSVVNYAFANFLTANEFDLFNITVFVIASIGGLIILISRRVFLNRAIQGKAIIGGILLGIPNYFSLLFLLHALVMPGWESSVIFPINNMGIVVLTAAGGWLIFREKLSGVNMVGIGVGLGAIVLMIFA